jgi:CheY-like chemotaxis protein
MLKAVTSLLTKADHGDSKPGQEGEGFALRRKTVLIVEDDGETRNLLRRHLKDDYDVVETGDPTEALRLVLERKPNCILLDLNMPRLSGIELGKVLSDMSVTQLIPIIVMTGEPAAQYKEVCEDFGAVDYIEKPLNFFYVKRRVGEVVNAKVQERRRKARVKLKVGLLLTGKTENGREFHVSLVSDDVSAGGFACTCTGELAVDSIIDVMLNGAKPRPVGRARVVRVERRGTPLQRYGFEFVAPPTNWIVK